MGIEKSLPPETVMRTEEGNTQKALTHLQAMTHSGLMKCGGSVITRITWVHFNNKNLDRDAAKKYDY